MRARSPWRWPPCWWPPGVDPLWLRRGAPWLYLAGLVLLVLVLVTGDIAKGGQRWLDFGIRFQPSEIMKLAVPMTLARVLHDRPLPPSCCSSCSAWPSSLVPTGLIADTAGPRHCRTDRADRRHRDLSRRPGLALHHRRRSPLAIAALPALWMVMHDYQRKRVLTLLNPDSDPAGRRLSHHPVENCHRLGRVFRQGLAQRQPGSAGVPAGALHGFHLRGDRRGMGPDGRSGADPPVSVRGRAGASSSRSPLPIRSRACWPAACPSRFSSTYSSIRRWSSG